VEGVLGVLIGAELAKTHLDSRTEPAHLGVPQRACATAAAATGVDDDVGGFCWCGPSLVDDLAAAPGAMRLRQLAPTTPRASHACDDAHAPGSAIAPSAPRLMTSIFKQGKKKSAGRGSASCATLTPAHGSSTPLKRPSGFNDGAASKKQATLPANLSAPLSPPPPAPRREIRPEGPADKYKYNKEELQTQRLLLVQPSTQQQPPPREARQQRGDDGGASPLVIAQPQATLHGAVQARRDLGPAFAAEQKDGDEQLFPSPARPAALPRSAPVKVTRVWLDHLEPNDVLPFALEDLPQPGDSSQEGSSTTSLDAETAYYDSSMLLASAQRQSAAQTASGVRDDACATPPPRPLGQPGPDELLLEDAELESAELDAPPLPPPPTPLEYELTAGLDHSIWAPPSFFSGYYDALAMLAATTAEDYRRFHPTSDSTGLEPGGVLVEAPARLGAAGHDYGGLMDTCFVDGRESRGNLFGGGYLDLPPPSVLVRRASPPTAGAKRGACSTPALHAKPAASGKWSATRKQIVGARPGAAKPARGKGRKPKGSAAAPRRAGPSTRPPGAPSAKKQPSSTQPPSRSPALEQGQGTCPVDDEDAIVVDPSHHVAVRLLLRGVGAASEPDASSRSDDQAAAPSEPEATHLSNSWEDDLAELTDVAAIELDLRRGLLTRSASSSSLGPELTQPHLVGALLEFGGEPEPEGALVTALPIVGSFSPRAALFHPLDIARNGASEGEQLGDLVNSMDTAASSVAERHEAADALAAIGRDALRPQQAQQSFGGIRRAARGGMALSATRSRASHAKHHAAASAQLAPPELEEPAQR
jgi:hypothetical protein